MPDTHDQDEWCGDCRRVVDGNCDAYRLDSGAPHVLLHTLGRWKRCTPCMKFGRPNPWWPDPMKPAGPMVAAGIAEMARILAAQRAACREGSVCTTCRPRIPPRKDGS